MCDNVLFPSSVRRMLDGGLANYYVFSSIISFQSRNTHFTENERIVGWLRIGVKVGAKIGLRLGSGL